MNNNNYKWKWQIPTIREGYHSFGLRPPHELQLIPLEGASSIPEAYQHKPGDVDYTDISRLSNTTKSKILYYVAAGIDQDGKDSLAVRIAACILIDRLSVPGFLPTELNPNNWND